MDQPIIVLQDIGVDHHRPGRAMISALTGINLELRAGESIAVYGPNGSGKSTLLRVMAGLEKPTHGHVSIYGSDAQDRDLPTDIRRRIGFVFQNPDDVFAAETVAEEIKFALECHRHSTAVSVHEVHDALAGSGLEHLADRPLQRLSGGEKQNIALCSVLAVRPDVIFFDEPTSYLDPPSRRAFLNHPVFIDDAKKRATVLVTQYWEEVMRCARVLVLKQGRIVYDGPPTGYAPDVGLPAGDAGSIDVLLCTAAAAPQTDPLAIVEGLNQTAPVFPGELTNPLRDISFCIRPGERIGLVGPTGAGKSTLAYHLTGLMPEFSGKITIIGQLVCPATASRHRPPVAMLFQNPEHHLFAETVAQDVAFGPRNVGFPKPEIDAHVERSLRLAGLPPAEFGGCSPFEISAGEQRKAALAGTLALPAALYIFDEPTAYLDMDSVARMEGILRALSAAGKAVLVIAHDLPFLRRVCPRWMVLDRGRLIYDGLLDVLEQDPAPLRSIGFLL